MIFNTEVDVEPWTLAPGHFLNLLFPHFSPLFFEDPDDTSLPLRYEIQLTELARTLQFLKPHFQLKSLGHLVALLTLLATLPPPTSKKTSPSQSFTIRLPIHLIRNPDPTIRSPRIILLKSALEYFESHSFDWQTWIHLPTFFTQTHFSFPSPQLSLNELLSYINEKLLEFNFISIPHLFLPPILKEHYANALKDFEKNVMELGWILDNDLTSETTHVLYPHIEHRVKKKEGLWIRSIELQESQCLVHPVYFPDSRDFWVTINEFSSMNNPYFHSSNDFNGMKYIDITWVLDSYAHQEIMNELDYLVKIDGTALTLNIQQKWDPLFLVQESGLVPSPYAKSHTLPQNNAADPFHPNDSQQNLEKTIPFKDCSASIGKSIPIFLHLSTLDSSSSSINSQLDHQILELPNSTSMDISDEESYLLISLRKHGSSLNENRYIKLRNSCIKIYQNAPDCLLRLKYLKTIDSNISALDFVRLVSYWEHQQWIHHMLHFPSSAPIPSCISDPLVNVSSSSFICPSCSQGIHSSPYYHSLLHPSIYICASCFASGRFHGPSMRYKRKDPVSALHSDWTATERIQLLYCVQNHGIDRWDLISREMQKPIESCLFHFMLPFQLPSQPNLVPFEVMPNPVLSLIHTLLPYAPPLAAHIAQQALLQLPKLDMRKLYEDSVPFAFQLAQSGHQLVQSHMRQLFTLIFRRIEVKWEILLELDHWIKQMILFKPSPQTSGSKACFKSIKKKLPKAV